MLWGGEIKLWHKHDTQTVVKTPTKKHMVKRIVWKTKQTKPITNILCDAFVWDVWMIQCLFPKRKCKCFGKGFTTTHQHTEPPNRNQAAFWHQYESLPCRSGFSSLSTPSLRHSAASYHTGHRENRGNRNVNYMSDFWVPLVGVLLLDSGSARWPQRFPTATPQWTDCCAAYLQNSCWQCGILPNQCSPEVYVVTICQMQFRLCRDNTDSYWIIYFTRLSDFFKVGGGGLNPIFPSRLFRLNPWQAQLCGCGPLLPNPAGDCGWTAAVRDYGECWPVCRTRDRTGHTPTRSWCREEEVGTLTSPSLSPSHVDVHTHTHTQTR